MSPSIYTSYRLDLMAVAHWLWWTEHQVHQWSCNLALPNWPKPKFCFPNLFPAAYVNESPKSTNPLVTQIELGCWLSRALDNSSCNLDSRIPRPSLCPALENHHSNNNFLAPIDSNSQPKLETSSVNRSRNKSSAKRFTIMDERASCRTSARNNSRPATPSQMAKLQS